MLCGFLGETADHQFTRCVFSRFVIEMGDGNADFQELGANVRDAWEAWLGGERPLEVAKALTFLSTNWWVL